MNTFTATVFAMMAGSAMAFAPSTSGQSSTAMKAGMPDRMWDQMVDKTERSASLPWLPRPKALDGSMVIRLIMNFVLILFCQIFELVALNFIVVILCLLSLWWLF